MGPEDRAGANPQVLFLFLIFIVESIADAPFSLPLTPSPPLQAFPATVVCRRREFQNAGRSWQGIGAFFKI